MKWNVLHVALLVGTNDIQKTQNKKSGMLKSKEYR